MVLVTGASGFLGQHLVRQLSAAGGQVRALYHSRLPEALTSLPGVTWQACDLLDVFAVEAAFSGIEEVYHCAAVVSFDPAKREALLQLNVAGTEHVVNAALEAGVRKLVAVSSVAALGRASGASAVITEEADWEESNRNSAYGASKYYAEMEVWRAIGEGLNAVIVNPGIILGEGDWSRSSARLMKVVDDEFPFYTEGINAWVDVLDVARAMTALMQSEQTAERYILSAGNFAYRDVFTRMAHALGRRPPRIKAPAPLTGWVGRWSLLKSRLTGTAPTVTPETARTAQLQCHYDNTKLPAALQGFRYTPLDETIARMAKAYRASKG